MTGQSIQPSDLNLEKIVFEIRYPKAFLLWDRHGEIWRTIEKARPDVRLMHAEPNRTIFRVGESFEAIVEIERAVSIAYLPKSSDSNFREFLVMFAKNVTEILEISSILRVGARFFYVKEYETQESASEALISTGLFKIPASPQFGVKGRIIDPSFRTRYEDDIKGACIRAYMEKQNIEFTPPLGVVDPPPCKRETIKLIFDVDIYSTVPLDIGQLSAEEWLKESERVVRRDIDRFIRS